jgi:hypothetical protein
VPKLAVQPTDVLKFPVPCTVALHWLVWLEKIDDGEQETLTETIVGSTRTGCGETPPQPQNHVAPTTTTSGKHCVIALIQSPQPSGRLLANTPNGYQAGTWLQVSTILFGSRKNKSLAPNLRRSPIEHAPSLHTLRATRLPGHEKRRNQQESGQNSHTPFLGEKASKQLSLSLSCYQGSTIENTR